MVFEKKQLSKVVAIFMIVACAVAFMPLLNGQAFAAAKKPGKAKITSAKVSGTSVTIKYKATNAKKYNIKVDKKVVKKNYSKKSFKIKNLKVGKHKIYVQGVNGKKKGKWSKAKTVTIKAVPDSVVIEGGWEANVGDTLEAVVYDKDGNPITSGVTYQWYRSGAASGQDNAIAGATEATYVVVAADTGKTLFVVAKVNGKQVKSTETSIVTNAVRIDSVKITGDAIVGSTLRAVVKDAAGNVIGSDAVTYQWFIGDEAVKGAVGATFTIPFDAADKTITVVAMGNGQATVGTAESAATPVVKNSGLRIRGASGYNKNADETYTPVPAVGDTLHAVVYDNAGQTTSGVTWQWYRGSNEIAGATQSTYEVKAADEGYTLTCKATVNGKVLGETTAKVVKPFGSDALVTVTSSNANSGLYTTADKATAKVEINATDPTKKADITANSVVTWGVWTYDRNASDSNEWTNFTFIYSAADKETRFEGATLDLSGKYYDADGKELTLNSKLLVAFARGDNTTYAGRLFNPAGFVHTALTATLTSDTGSAVKPNVTTLTATVFKGDLDVSDTVLSYTWERTVNGTNWMTFEPTTPTTYVPAETDANMGITQFRVTAALGTGQNALKLASAVLPVTWMSDTAPVAVTYDVHKMVDDTVGDAASTVTAGTRLKAVASVAKAQANLNTAGWTWTIAHASGAADTTAEGEFFDTTGLVAGDTVTLSNGYTGSAWTVSPGENVKVTIAAAITKVNVASDKKYGIAGKPEVGDTLTASVEPAGSTVTYQWYRGNDKIADATNAAYTVTTADLGAVLSVVAKDATGTEVSSAATATLDPVTAVVKVEVTDDQRTLNAETPAHVGDNLTVSVVTESGTALGKDDMELYWENGTANGEEATFTVAKTGALKLYVYSSACRTIDGVQLNSYSTPIWNNNGLNVVED